MSKAKEPDYNELYREYHSLLLQANAQVSKQAVDAGYVSPWLKVQAQAFRLMEKCKDRLDGKQIEQLTELEELGL